MKMQTFLNSSKLSKFELLTSFLIMPAEMGSFLLTGRVPTNLLAASLIACIIGLLVGDGIAAIVCAH